MREIDDELCHHTDMGGWNIKVWPLQVGVANGWQFLW